MTEDGLLAIARAIEHSLISSKIGGPQEDNLADAIYNVAVNIDRAAQALERIAEALDKPRPGRR